MKQTVSLLLVNDHFIVSKLQRKPTKSSKKKTLFLGNAVTESSSMKRKENITGGSYMKIIKRRKFKNSIDQTRSFNKSFPGARNHAHSIT